MGVEDVDVCGLMPFAFGVLRVDPAWALMVQMFAIKVPLLLHCGQDTFAFALEVCFKSAWALNMRHRV